MGAIALNAAKTAGIIAAHAGYDTYEEDRDDDEGLWHVTCDGCDWDAVITGAPADDHAAHIADKLVEAGDTIFDGRAYELSDELHPGLTNLRRIRAVRDLPRHGVKAGDLGGFISAYRNLAGNAWVAGEAIVMDDAVVSGEALVSGRSEITARAQVKDRATVIDCILDGHAVAEGEAKLDGITEIGIGVFTANADVTDPYHFQTTRNFRLGPVTIHRTATGHLLTIRDIWSGAVEELSEAMLELDAYRELDDVDREIVRRDVASLVRASAPHVIEWEANR